MVHLSRKTVRLTLCGSLLLISIPVLATTVRHDWLWVTNMVSQGDGVRLDLDHDGLIVGGTPQNSPCVYGESSCGFSPHGENLGISRNIEFDAGDPYLYVSITGEYGYESCGAPSGQECVGVAKVDVNSLAACVITSTFTRNWDTADYQTTAVAPDALGQNDYFVVASKNDGTVRQYNTPTRRKGTYSGSEVSQLEWVELPFYVATLPYTKSSPADCDEVTSNSQLLLRKMGSDWDTTTDDTGLTPPSTPIPTGSKVEGIAVKAIDPDNDDSCDPDSDYVIYATDYCRDVLYVYSVDTDVTQPTLVYETTIELDEDYSGHATMYTPEKCHPSTVVARTQNLNLFVLCQSRDTIIKIHTDTAYTDQCAPRWVYNTDEARLKKNNDANAPSCTHDPDLTPCGGEQANGTGDCAPHDAASNGAFWSSWLFVTLTEQGQVIAVKDSSLTTQHLIYKTADTTPPLDFEPMEAEAISNCAYGDPNCVYP